MSRALLKDAVWLQVASEISRLSTCRRLHVGCVLLRANGSVAGTGYNGSLPGAEHCTPERCNETNRCLWTRHAERSALDYSVGPIETAYCTDEPCLRCTLDLVARSVKRVVFKRRYQPTQAEALERDRIKDHYQLKWEHVH